MKLKLQFFIVILVGCSLVGGCAHKNPAQEDVEALKSQIIELQKSIADVNLRMEELANSIYILQEQSKSNKEAIKLVAQPKIYIQGEIPAESYLDDSQSQTPVPLPQGGNGMPEYGTDKIKGAVSAGIPVNEAGLGASSEFSSAMASYKKENFGLAVFDFTSFLSKNTNSPETEQALYYLGMSYLRLNEFAQAAREWNKLISRFSASARAPEVTYRIGTAYNALGEKERARTFFDLVIRKYQGSKWAGKAASALKQ